MPSMTEDERTALEIQNINKILLTVSSAERAEVSAYTSKPSGGFLARDFSSTGRTATTWYLRDDLLGQLQRFEDEAPGVQFLSAETRAAYDVLTDPVRVFRGCPRERVMAAPLRAWRMPGTCASGPLPSGTLSSVASDPIGFRA